MVLNEQQIQEFKDKGFIVLKGFFDADEMARISACLDDMRDREPAENAEAKYYEESVLSGENVLVRIENVIGEHNAEFSALVMPPRVSEALEQLLGEAPVMFKEKVNYKLP